MHILACAFQTTRCYLSCFELKRSKCRTVFVHLTCLTFFLFVQPVIAQAVMSPETYAKASSESRIKAIATIVDVQIIQVGDRATTKNVNFKLEYTLTKDTADTFTGSCSSVDTKKQQANAMAGGETYFYPNVGDRVFVTVKKDGARITSMTPMSKELEQIVREQPERIEYGITQVSIGDKESSAQQIQQFEPVLRGKGPAPRDQEAVTLLGETWIAQPKQSSEDLNGQLLIALGNDDLSEVKLFLDSGADVNAANARGMTPIMMAESAKMAQLLLDRGANPKAIDADGGSVIHYAVTRNNAPELIKLFAAKGVDPNLRGWDAVPAIFVAADFFYEAKAFEPKIGAENEPSWPSPKNVLKALVDAGVDLNATDDHGNTLLMNATVQDNAEMVNLLLELGADKSIKKNGDGSSAKEMAYEMGHRYIFQLLE